jgi:hypothetical protein
MSRRVWTRTGRKGEPVYVSGPYRITVNYDPDEFDPEGRHYEQWTLWENDYPIDLGQRFGDMKRAVERIDARKGGQSRIRRTPSFAAQRERLAVKARRQPRRKDGRFR